MLGTAIRMLAGKIAFYWLARRSLLNQHDRHHTGRRSEQLAAFFLRSQGYRIVARNYRAGLLELDLVAVRGWELVFVEVKGTASGHADPLQQVTPAKERLLRKAARHFLRDHGLHDPRIRVRFDVITVRWPQGEQEGRPSIRHYAGAF